MHRQKVHRTPETAPDNAAPGRGALLERDPQLAQLQQCFERVRRTARGECVLVHGEAGIGKTSLVNAFVRGLQPQAARVLVAGCEALLTARPLGPLVDMADAFPPSVANALHEGRLWNGLFPSLLAWLRDAPSLSVLVIEDMHWADAGTLDFVRYAGRRLRDARVLLVLTYRSDELEADHALRRVLGELPADATTRIAVPPLTAAAVGVLADRGHRSRRGVFEATGGNPFFVTEVLASEESGVPPSVSDAVLGRLAQLPAEGRAAAEQVSVFPNQVARTLLNSIGAALGAGVDACLHRGLLVTRGGFVAFRHELAREAVLASLLPHRRVALNAAAFEALRAEDHDEEALTRLVHHAEGAGLTTELVRLAPRAAYYAAKAGAQREAARLFGLAVRHGASLDEAERAALLEAQAVACMLTSRHEEAIAARREALQLRRNLGDRLGEGSNLRWLARLYILIEGTTTAFECARQSVELLEQLPPGNELALAYSTLSHLHLLEIDIASADSWGVKAIALAEALGATEALCHALNTVGSARLRLRDDPDAWAMLERSLALSLEHGFDADAARAFNNLFIMSVTQRNFLQAAGYAERGIAYCESRGIDVYTVRLRIRRAFVSMQTGAWDRADHDLALVRESHAPSAMERATCAFVQHLLDLRRGRPHAQPELAATIDTMQRLDVRIWFTSFAAARLEAAWLREAPDAVIAALPALASAACVGDAWQAAELAAWARRLGRPADLSIPAPPRPYALELDGDLRGASAEWLGLGCPYESALVLAGGDADDLRAALATLEQLGASAAAELVRRRLRRCGASGVSRGPRPRTREDPLGFTARERQVFGLLLQGMSNAAIAARLHRSERTVEHHVAAVLAKTRTGNRAALIAGYAREAT